MEWDIDQIPVATIVAMPHRNAVDSQEIWQMLGDSVLSDDSAWDKTFQLAGRDGEIFSSS